MDKKKKGLIDDNNGDFILNESGTSVNNPWNADESLEKDDTSPLESDVEDEKNETSGKEEDDTTSE